MAHQHIEHFTSNKAHVIDTLLQCPTVQYSI